MDIALPQSKNARVEPRADSRPETSKSSAQRPSIQQKTTRLKENRGESDSMFITEKAMVLPHRAVIEEADAKTNASCCPCFKSARQAEEDVPRVAIPPEARFKNGGSLAYRNEVVQQEKNPCTLL
jgi:hypothetical protein